MRNPIIFRKSPVITKTNPIIFRVNFVIVMTSPVIFRTKSVIFRAHEVKFRTNPVIFRTNPVKFFGQIRSYLVQSSHISDTSIIIKDIYCPPRNKAGIIICYIFFIAIVSQFNVFVASFMKQIQRKTLDMGVNGYLYFYSLSVYNKNKSHIRSYPLATWKCFHT